MTPPKVLVTGGAGYIGSILVPALLEKGYAVQVLDKFIYNQTSLLDCCDCPRLEIMRGDCRDKETLSQALRNADYVLPLAAIVGAPVCDGDRITATTTNLEAVKLLISLKSPQQRLVFPCTNSGYGLGERDKYCTEESPLRPISLYGRTKVEAEAALLDTGSCISVRLATVFGVSPRMRTDLLVNDFVHRAVTDRSVLIFEGHFKRNYIHIRDVARAFLHCMEHFEEMQGAYNVGLSSANLSKIELCEKIRQYVPGFVYLEAAIGEDPDKRDYMVSNDKIERTGFLPAFSLEDGIQELIRAYRILRTRPFGNY